MATITSVWEALEEEAKHQTISVDRLYRALGATAIGVRASYLPRQNILELLIEVPLGWSGNNVLPKWRGMGHEVMPLGLPPRKEAHQLRIFLESQEHRDVFMIVCEDLVSTLEGVTEATQRVWNLEVGLLRWRRFFERTGPDGLSAEMQQGLFAELVCLQRLLKAGVDPLKVVTAWKGCERRDYDFDLGGHVIEVKSTRGKEPKSVAISSERQLDDRDLQSLHLYVLTVHEVENGGLTLPEQVESVRQSLINEPVVLADFQDRLVSTGYLDRDAGNYTRHLIVKAEDLYRVGEGFPRITSVPSGVGDMHYCVILAVCEPYRANLDNHLMRLVEIANG